jgi:hypothetical protein
MGEGAEGKGIEFASGSMIAGQIYDQPRADHPLASRHVDYLEGALSCVRCLLHLSRKHRYLVDLDKLHAHEKMAAV